MRLRSSMGRARRSEIDPLASPDGIPRGVFRSERPRGFQGSDAPSLCSGPSFRLGAGAGSGLGEGDLPCMQNQHVVAAAVGLAFGFAYVLCAEPVARLCLALGLWGHELEALLFDPYLQVGAVPLPVATTELLFSPRFLIFCALEAVIARELFARIGLRRGLLWTVLGALLLRWLVGPVTSVVLDVVMGRSLEWIPYAVRSRDFWIPNVAHFVATYDAAVSLGLAFALLLVVPRSTADAAIAPRVTKDFRYGRASTMELNRLVLASLLRPFSSTRSRILRIARNRHLPVKPEPGLDPELVLGFAKYLERRDFRYRLLFLSAGIGLLVVPVDPELAPFALVAAAFAIVTQFVKFRGTRLALCPLLTEASFDPEKIRRRAWVAPTPTELARLASQGQNVVLYSASTRSRSRGRMAPPGP